MDLCKSVKIVWRTRGSWGPDLEYILFVPVLVAVETKRTVKQAEESVNQLISYAEKYDALFLHLEEKKDPHEFLALKELAMTRGIGILLGGSRENPLATADIVYAAKLEIKSGLDLSEVCRSFGNRFKAEFTSGCDIHKQIVIHACIRKMFAQGDMA
ncbi:MAG: hypothetical protein QXE77_03895 [Desulfurococcaceae archaeon]